MSKIKKPLALLLSLLMLMTAMPLMAISASAVTASQLDFVLSHLPNERNAHYYKDSTEAAILAAREAAETALETGEGIAAAYNLCLGAFDEAWACDEVAYNEYGDTVFVFVNRDESKAHATLYLDTDASASLKPGDTFDVTFSIKADFPLRQFRVAFAYDKAVFEADGSSITYADGITDLLDVNSYPLYTEYGYFNGSLNKTRQFYPVEWDQDMISKYNFVVKEFGRNTEKDADYMLPTEKTEIFTVTMKVKDDAGLVGKTGEIFLCNEMLSTMENDYLFDGVPALPIKIYRGFSTNPYEEVADDDINIRQACKVTDEGAGVGQTITWDGTALKTYSIVGEGEEPTSADWSFPTYEYSKSVTSSVGNIAMDVVVRNTNKDYSYEITSIEITDGFNFTSPEMPFTVSAEGNETVNVTGSVSSSKPGSLTFTYNVLDESSAVIDEGLVDSVYFCANKGLATDAFPYPITKSGIAGEYPKGFYATSVEELCSATITIRNASSGDMTGVAAISYGATAANFVSDYIALVNDEVTIPKNSQVTLKLFKTTAAYDALTDEQKAAEWVRISTGEYTDGSYPYKKYGNYKYNVGSTAIVSDINIVLHDDFGLSAMIAKEDALHRQARDYLCENGEWEAYQAAMLSTYGYFYTNRLASTFAGSGKSSAIRKMSAYAETLATAIENLDKCYVAPEEPGVDLSVLSTGAKVQFGTKEGSPVEWVIGGDGTTGMSAPEGCIALVSSGLVASDTAFEQTGYSNIYATSNLRSVVENAVSFTDGEKVIIQSRTLGSPDIAGDPVTAAVWAPTLADAVSLSDAGLSGTGSFYWLCSPGEHDPFAANVYPDGGVEPYGVDTYDPEGVRAGLYLDLSKITKLTLVEGTTDTYIFNAPEEEPGVDLSKLSTGAKIQLGTQNSNPVEWVIGGDGTTGMSAPTGCIALVSSDVVASNVAFDPNGKSNVYSTSNVRSIVESAVTFTDDEQAAIQSRTLAGNQTYGQACDGVAGDSVTADVWAPTTKDAYALSHAGLSAASTDYWLCSPGDSERYAARAYSDIGVSPLGDSVHSKNGVRAALYLDLSKIEAINEVEDAENTYTLDIMHTHAFSEEWSKDETAHWHECTAEECDIEDYSTCGIDEVAYGEHIGMEDFVCDICGYTDTENQLAAAKEDAVDAIDGLVESADSDAVKALAEEAKEKIADAETAEEVEDIIEEYTDKISYRKLSEDMTAEYNDILGSDRYSDEVKAIITDALDEMENTETYEELNALYEETQKEIVLQQTREEYIAELEKILEEDIYSDKVKDMVEGFLEEIKEIDNLEDLNAFNGECDKKLAHQYFKDVACKELLDLAGENPSEEVMKIINDAVDEIQGMEETPDFDDNYMEIFEGIINQAEKDVAAQREAEAEALAGVISAAKAELEEAKKDYVSDEAATILDGAIAALDDAESLDDVNTIKSEALENAEGADNALAEAIATAKAELEIAKNNAKSDKAKAALDEAIANVDKATNPDDVASAKTAGTTAAAEADGELAEVKATAKEALNAALTNAKSDAAKAALNEAIAIVDNATDPDAVAEAKTTGTINAAIADNALANAQAEAKKVLEAAKEKAVSDEAKAAIDKAIANVEKATNPADAASAKSAGEAAAANADKTLADTITTAKANLETAKNNAKSNAAKAAYTDAIAALDNAKSMEAIETIVEGAEMAAANADKALADAQAEAKETLKTAKENAQSDEAKAFFDDALAALDYAASPEEVQWIIEAVSADAATADKALADAKGDAKAALEAAKEKAVSDEAKAAIDKAIANVEKATNPADAASAKSAGITAADNADKTLAETISNFKKNLETAKNDAKSDAAKDVYTNAIAALDNAKSLEDVETIVEGAEMNAANADKALADAKTDAKKELETAKTNAVSDAAKAALDEAIANVEKATSPADVASAKSAGTTDAAAADKALADAKDAAKSDLAAAKENAKSDAAKAALDEAIANVEKATSPADVASEKAAAETAAAEADNALADAQAEAKKVLETAKEKAVSDEAKAALDEAIADVEKATNPTATAAAKNSGLENAADADEALAEAIKNAKADLARAEENAVADDAKAALAAAAEDMDNATSLAAVADKKAAAEEAAEAAEKELADAKAAAIEAVEALAGDDATDEVKQLVEDAKEAINAATNTEAVDTAEDNGLATVAHKQQEEGFTVPDLDIQLGYRETAPVNAESTTNKIIYTSSNEKVVTVDEDGNLKAVGKGKATITATLDCTDISKEIEIEVSYTFWDALVWHIRNLIDLIAGGFKWLLGLIGINL